MPAEVLVRLSSIALGWLSLSSLSTVLEGLTTQPPALSDIVFLGVTFSAPPFFFSLLEYLFLTH